MNQQQDGNAKERREFVAAQAAVAGQLDAFPYKIRFDPQRLELTLHAKRAGLVPGLVFDAFHLGLALATRDALNQAYALDRPVADGLTAEDAAFARPMGE